MKPALPIPRAYAYLAALLLTLLMVLQTSNMEAGQIQLNLNQIILFGWNYLTWAFTLGWVFHFTNRYQLEGQTWKKDLLPLALTGLVICGIQLLVSNMLYYLSMYLLRGFTWADMVNGFSNVFVQAYASRLVDFIVILGILRGLSNYQKLNQQKLAVAELQSMLTQTRLEALKMQLNPHFLFNALHAIHSMIGYDNEKARSILLKISSLLRKILEMGEKQVVSLSEELSYLRDYLDIEQERFHDRLQIHYQLSDDLLDAEVPSLLLQPLAENALKHGISQLEGTGEIYIRIVKAGEDFLDIHMQNTTGHSLNGKAVSLGIGLNNLKKRLEQLYDNDFELSTQQDTDEFSVAIKIPLTYED